MSFDRHWIVWGIFILIPMIADQVTGFFLSKGLMLEGAIGSASQIARLFCLAIALVVLAKNRANSNLPIISLIVLGFLFIEVVAFSDHQDAAALVYGLTMISKIIFPVAVFTFFLVFAAKKRSPQILIDFLFAAVVLFCVCLWLPLMFGLGESAYGGNSSGFKGFFPSANGLGVALGISILTLITVKRKINLLLLALCIATLVVCRL